MAPAALLFQGIQDTMNRPPTKTLESRTPINRARTENGHFYFERANRTDTK
jgi:hypothetical protein